MKRTSTNLFTMCVLICIIAFSLMLSACSPIVKQGLDNFGLADSTLSLCSHLLPSEEFLTTSNYIGGDYRYWDQNDLFSTNTSEKVFLYLEYAPADYQKAKEYCLSNMQLSSKNTKEHNGYVFTENLALGSNASFPYHFNMFGYNDSLNQLFFIGYHNSKAIYSYADGTTAELAENDFGSFLNTVFGEYYDFGQ